MVLLGGLELVAAGYLIHKHNKNKREKEALREELAQAEEELEREEEREERHERHRRRRSRERREREKWEAEHGVGFARPGRANSVPPTMSMPVKHSHSHAPVPAAYPSKQRQTPQPGFPPTGWPAHWSQSQTPPVNAQATGSGYPPDIKYGFVPDIPHDQYPPYPPPPFSPSPGPSDRGRRAQTLDVNEGRDKRRRHRRSASPRIGLVDEFEESEREEGRGRERRSPVPHVRFSAEDVVLGENGRARSPPPSYTSRR